MKKKTIKSVVCAVCATMSLGSVALADWVPAGYVTSDAPNYTKVYNEKVNGSFTSRSKLVPVTDVQWKSEGFEVAYPHLGYERLYLEGNAQVETRYDNTIAQWETRMKDYFWEVSGSHQIYQRQQTNIPGKGWTWDFGNDALGYPDSFVFTPTTRNADVDVAFSYLGVGYLDKYGKVISLAQADVYNYLGLDYQNAFNITDKLLYILRTKSTYVGDYEYDTDYDGVLSLTEILSAVDYYGVNLIDDADIAFVLPAYVSKYVTGPTYYGENATKDVNAMMVNQANAGTLFTNGWYWDADSVKEVQSVIGWTDWSYEMADTYALYQYLTVNGIVMNGENGKPYIYRYGGCATPQIEWRYAFPEADGPFKVVEQKFMKVNGKWIPATDADGKAIYRTNTGEYANSYIVTTSNEVQLWLRDGIGKDVMIDSVSNVPTYFNYYDGYVQGAF